MERKQESERVPAGAAGDILYRLNDEDQIVYVNEAWDQFATANEATHLTGGQVFRRLLWDFITDPSTLQLYRDVLNRVRSGRPAQFSFRCDSPTRRRLMQMEIRPADNRAVEFRTRALSETDRPPQLLLDVRENRTNELLKMCSWCKKVDIGGAWAEVEEAVSRLQLFEQRALPGLTHGICETCFTKAAKEFSSS